MSKIYLYLSGVWPGDGEFDEDGDDLYYRAPNTDVANSSKNWITLPDRENETEAILAKRLSNLCNELSDEKVRSIVQSFICEYLHYTITPIAAIVSELDSVFKSVNPTKIVMISARSSGALPMLGFQTAESARGSKHLLYSRIATALPSIFSDQPFCLYNTKGDFWLWEPFRKNVLWLANCIFAFWFVFRIWFLSHLFQKDRKVELTPMVIFMRVRHQLRFVNQLVSNGIHADVMLIPQLTQGSLKADKEMVEAINKNASQQTITLKMLMRAIRSTRRDTRKLKDVPSQQPKTNNISIAGRDIPFSWSSFTKEILLASATILHKNIVEEVLKAGNYQRLLNFELVGRFAGLEYAAAQEAGAKAVTLQTAIISDRPHPIFPLSDFFYADSPSNAEMLAEIGVRRNGTVRFAGYPYPIEPVDLDGVIRDISFFTQPYETSATKKILAIVAEHAAQKGMSLKIRLHPRDVSEHYDTLLKQWPETISVLPSGNLPQALAMSDLCITRTSSVAKEALATGKPIILAMWTDFDRSVKGDYISSEANLDYCARDADDLKRMLDNLQSVQASADELHRQLFAGGSTADLVSSINSL